MHAPGEPYPKRNISVQISPVGNSKYGIVPSTVTKVMSPQKSAHRQRRYFAGTGVRGAGALGRIGVSPSRGTSSQASLHRPPGYEVVMAPASIAVTVRLPTVMSPSSDSRPVSRGSPSRGSRTPSFRLQQSARRTDFASSMRRYQLPTHAKPSSYIAQVPMRQFDMSLSDSAFVGGVDKPRLYTASSPDFPTPAPVSVQHRRQVIGRHDVTPAAAGTGTATAAAHSRRRASQGAAVPGRHQRTGMSKNRPTTALSAGAQPLYPKLAVAVEDLFDQASDAASADQSSVPVMGWGSGELGDVILPPEPHHHQQQQPHQSPASRLPVASPATVLSPSSALSPTSRPRSTTPKAVTRVIVEGDPPLVVGGTRVPHASPYRGTDTPLGFFAAAERHWVASPSRPET